MHIDGSGLRWLTKPVNPGGSWDRVWSPDGSKLANTRRVLGLLADDSANQLGLLSPAFSEHLLGRLATLAADLISVRKPEDPSPSTPRAVLYLVGEDRRAELGMRQGAVFRLDHGLDHRRGHRGTALVVVLALGNLAGEAVARLLRRGAGDVHLATSPITLASGKKKVVAARFIHNDRLIDALMVQAFAALNASPGARAYYDGFRNRGIEYNDALRRLANRLVGILHGCLKTRTLYDEATAWSHREETSPSGVAA